MTGTHLAPGGGLDRLLEQLLTNRQTVVHQRSQARTAAEQVLLDARAAGREKLTGPEDTEYRAATAELRARSRELAALNQRIDDLRADTDRAGQISQTLARLRDPQNTSATSETSSSMRTQLSDSRHLVYRKHDPASSYLRDLVLTTQQRDDTGKCLARLREHADQVATFTQHEARAISRVDGQGGFFVPPAWLIDSWIEYARPGRAFANIVTSSPLPGGTDSINVPRILTGTATGIQTADNTPVTEVDLTDTFITSPVRTIAGQQSVSLQLLDQSPVNMDDVILTDLAAAQAVNVDKQVLYGSGSAGQVLGVANWPGINTIAVADQTTASLYAALANAINQIWTQRFAAPTAIVLHPRRWADLLSRLDQNDRPLFLPQENNPQNAAGILSNVEPQDVVGRALGLPIITDASISTTLGTGSPSGSEDSIFVLRAQDCVLYESGVRARVMPEPLAGSLTVLIQLYSYIAFAVRFPASIVEITGLQAPTF